jgi:hypothetical protein
MKKPEPVSPSLGEDEEARREMIRTLVDFIHRCSELDLDYAKISDIALSIQNLEACGTSEE